MNEPAIPGGLADHYRWDDGALVLRGLEDAWIGRAMFGVAGLCVVVALIGGALGMGPLSLIAGALTPAFVVFGAMNLLDREDLPYRLDGEGLTLRNHGTFHYDRIALSGEVGEALRLAVHGPDGWVELQRGFPTPPWTIEGLLWFTEQLERIGGVQRSSTVDVEGWRRWAEDPDERRRITLARRVAKSAATFPDLHGIGPVEPEDAQLSVDALTWRGAVLDRDEVQGEGKAMLAEVLDAQVVVEQRANLLVRTSTALVPILSVDPTEDDVAGLAWFAARIREAAARAVPARDGTASDVPDALKALTRREEA